VLEQTLLAPATLDRPGDTIAGKYRLDQILGQGGMGTVWQAHNVALDSPVAIKVLSAAVDSSALRERLLIEARAAAKLAHPAIVKVFDVDETERGAPFIVMELLSGASLGALLAREARLPPARAVQLLLPIVDALRLAHDKGLVHRDVKPDNVFIVDGDGATQPKLVDFGIVKVEHLPGDSSLTRDGDVMGSPDYMSPEQARGEAEITSATDIWALSVVLYECIAGNPPFSGPNYNALLWQIVEAEPQTLAQLGSADQELSAIVARGLSKQPAARFSSMRELGRALAEWLLKQGITEDVCGTSLESRWSPQGGAREGSGPWNSSVWSAEARSGLRPKLTPRLPETTARTVPRGRGAARRWVAVGARVGAVGVIAVAGALAFTAIARRHESPFTTLPHARVVAAPAPKALQQALPPSSSAPSIDAIDPEALPLEAPNSEATPAEEGQSRVAASSRTTRRYWPRSPAPVKTKQKDLLNPY